MFRFFGRLIWKLIGKLFKLFLGIIIFFIVIGVVLSSPSKKEKTPDATKETSVVKNKETDVSRVTKNSIKESQTEHHVSGVKETEREVKADIQELTDKITEKQTEKQTTQPEKEVLETKVRETEIRIDDPEETKQKNVVQKRTTQAAEDQEVSIPEEPVFVTVKRGASGDSVKEVQERLVALGFMASTPDGKFGPKTEQSVMDFQKAAGIDPSGIIDQATYTKLISKQAPKRETEGSAQALTRSNTTRMYATANVNVRSGPSAQTDRLGTLSQGETVRAGKAENDWTPIIYASGIGYVSSNYLSASAPVLALAPVSNSQTSQDTRTVQQPETQSSQVQTQTSSPEVWVPRSGGKFHTKKTCSGMKDPIGMSLAEAKVAGIKACGKCAKGW